MRDEMLRHIDECIQQCPEKDAFIEKVISVLD